jgi:hypothetical protein
MREGYEEDHCRTPGSGRNIQQVNFADIDVGIIHIVIAGMAKVLSF